MFAAIYRIHYILSITITYIVNYMYTTLILLVILTTNLILIFNF